MGKTCTKCGKMNHFRAVCRSSHVQNITHENNTNSNSNDEEDANYTWHINTKPRKFSPHFSIDIGSSSVSMMADSGASVNLLAERDYRNLKQPPSLRPSPARIYAYGKTQPIATLGEFVAKLCYKNRSCLATLIVIKDGPSSLLSWTTSQKLKLLSVVNAVADNSVEQLVLEYAELFTGLGKLKDYKVHLHIDDTIQPVAQMHRRIPFHVRKDLEAQLKADEDLGVIQPPTGPTPWVSPVVCVPKKNGKMRVCVDIRSPNIAIKRERH